MTKKNDKKLEVQTEIDDLNNKWKRALADYQNLERRIDTEKEGFVKFANAQMLLKILPALDTLITAQKHLGDEGLGLGVKQLVEGLESEGVVKIETVGKEFDPNIMECIGVEDGEENKVTEELRTGYLINDKLLRPAQVKVGKSKI